jgi:hypothetical protein
MTDKADDENKAADELPIEEQVEQAEEAADAVEEAIKEGDLDRAQNILDQLEAWKSDLFSTLEKAQQSQLSPILDEIRELKADLQKAKKETEPSASSTPSPEPETEPKETPPTPRPPMDAKQMERPESGADASPAQESRVSPRQNRRGI